MKKMFKHWSIPNKIIFSFDPGTGIMRGSLYHLIPGPSEIKIDKNYIPSNKNLIDKSNLLFDKYVQLRDDNRKNMADIFYQKYTELRGRIWANPSLS